MALQESGEMYLETILILSQQNPFVRSVDISEHMGYSKPSVSRAVSLLKAGEYITVDDDGHIQLTDSGRQVAEKILSRHKLLTDLLTLAAQMEDGLALERSLLGANLTVESNRIRYSEKEKCQYAYFTCTSERATYILCFYLRGAEQIDDVEFQLLYLRHASGETEDLAAMDYNAKKQASALMAASELLMTGKSRAEEGLIPFSYAVGEAQAKVERTEFKGTPDRGSLINYRLKK